MDTIERILSVLEKIKRAGAERILRTTLHALDPWLIAIGVAPNHIRRRGPVRPCLLVLNGRGAAELQSGFADAHTGAQCLAILQNAIAKTLVRTAANPSGWLLAV